MAKATDVQKLVEVTATRQPQDVLKQLGAQVMRETPPTPTTQDSDRAKLAPSRRTLRDLWSKLAGIYGDKFTRAFGDAPEHMTAGAHHEAGDLTDAGAVWQQGLMGLSRQQVGDGLRRSLMNAEPWPPTLPEFRARCLGIPMLAQVQLLLTRCNDVDTDNAAFCRLVWRFLDGHRFTWAEPDDADRMLRDAYRLAREYRMELGPLPSKPAAAIPFLKQPKPSRASQETAEAEKRLVAERLGMEIGPDGIARDRHEPPANTDDTDGQS